MTSEFSDNRQVQPAPDDTDEVAGEPLPKASGDAFDERVEHSGQADLGDDVGASERTMVDSSLLAGVQAAALEASQTEFGDLPEPAQPTPSDDTEPSAQIEPATGTANSRVLRDALVNFHDSDSKYPGVSAGDAVAASDADEQTMVSRPGSRDGAATANLPTDSDEAVENATHINDDADTRQWSALEHAVEPTLVPPNNQLGRQPLHRPRPEEDEGHTSQWGQGAADVPSQVDEPSVLTPHSSPDDTDNGDDEDEDPWAAYEDSSKGWAEDATTGRRVVDQAKLRAELDAESGGSFVRRQTGTYDSCSQQPGQAMPQARLIALQGLDSDLEVPIMPGENSLGRSSGNTFMLPHASISRQHALITLRDDVFLLRDLASGNGTFVNGEKVAQVELQSGDEVCLGQVSFRFLRVGEAFKPVDSKGRPVLPGARLGASKRLSLTWPPVVPRVQEFWQRFRGSENFSLIMALSILGLCLMGALGLWLHRSSHGPKTPSEVVFDFFMQGRDAFKRRDWQLAEEHFSVVLRLNPRHERGKRYLDVIAKERVFDTMLAESREHYNGGALLQTYTKASTIENSIYSTDASELLKAIDAELGARVARARTSLQAGRVDEARRLLTDVEAIRPGRPDVAALLDQADQSSTPTAPSKPSAKPAVVQASASTSASSVVSRKVLEHFEKEDIAGALAVLAEEGGSLDRELATLQATIERFKTVHENALEAYRAKRSAVALALLGEAKVLEAKITGGRSPLAISIRKKLADMFHVAGIDAMLANDLPKAYENFRRAIDHDQEHKPAMRSLSTLGERADTLLKQMDTISEDKRREPLELILRIVPPTHEAHKAAAGRLSQMR